MSNDVSPMISEARTIVTVLALGVAAEAFAVAVLTVLAVHAVIVKARRRLVRS